MADAAVLAAITQAAQQQGVDPTLAVAMAQVESGLNPLAIGDQGHSVGLFQLHDQGEGAGMSVAQRQDPYTNASVALRQVAAVAAQNPGLDPGVLAALAQRPADPTAYAQKIDVALGQVRSGSLGPLPAQLAGWGPGGVLPTPGDLWNRVMPGGSGIGDPLGIGSAVGGAVAGAFGGVFSGLFGAVGTGITNAVHNIGEWARSQAVALAVAAIVVLVVFA